MYADRYARPAVKPGALGVAIGLNGAIIAALMLSAPEIVTVIDTSFEGRNIPLPEKPKPIPEIKPKTEVKPKIEQRVFDPPPAEKPMVTDQPVTTKTDYVVPSGPSGMDGGVAGGTGTTPYEPPAPVWIRAQPDPRYAGAFQPAYPPGERRAGNEGRVTVRVLIGVDGRVKQVELVSAASDDFFAVTRRQALAKWRFRPATRDGIPQEEWRTMSVSFVLNEDG